MNLQTILKHSIREQLANCNCITKLNPTNFELDKLIESVLSEGFAIPKNFHKIPLGSNNWRSAAPSEDELISIISNNNIKTVIRFNGDGSDSGGLSIKEEAEICNANGCKFYKLSSRDDQDTVNKLLNAGNALVHCHHGADRTGGNIGGWLYIKGWGTTKKIWNYTTQYNGWNRMVINSPNKFRKGGYLFQASKFGVDNLKQATDLANNKPIDNKIDVDIDTNINVPTQQDISKQNPGFIDNVSLFLSKIIDNLSKDKQIILAKKCGWSTWKEYKDSNWQCNQLRSGSTGNRVKELQKILNIKLDGIFGPQTQACIKHFQKYVNLPQTGKVDTLTNAQIKKIVSGGINGYISPAWCTDYSEWKKHAKKNDLDIKSVQTNNTNNPDKISNNVPRPINSMVTDNNWQSIAARYIAKKESFTEFASYDENRYRAGYGSDKILKNGVLVDIKPGMSVTQEDAINTLVSYSIPQYSKQIEKDLGYANWDKLNDNQKAALTSLGYNVGKHYIAVKDYGKKIKNLISAGDLTAAGNAIYTDGPKSGKKSGYLRGLEKRRREESELFNS